MSPEDFIQFILRNADYTQTARAIPGIEGIEFIIHSVGFTAIEAQTFSIERVYAPNTIVGVYNNVLSPLERDKSHFSLRVIGDIEFEGIVYADMPLLELDFDIEGTTLNSCVYPFDRDKFLAHLEVKKHDVNGLTEVEYKNIPTSITLSEFLDKIKDLKNWQNFSMRNTPLAARPNLRLVK